MKIPAFLGGTDEQRSKNLSDNNLINLYPTTNDDGSIAAFYKVDGLKSEGTLSGVPTGAYKASNGRAFYTSGTVLYELTIVAGVYTSTSRGTITTATNYEFSDNGIEMIMVNGTDGWIFTFLDNSLDNLIAITGDFTVQAATYADVDATITRIAHGLSIGDRVTFSTTGALPSNLLTDTAYYVLADGFTVDSFKVGLTLTGAVCTITNATPAVISSADHGFFQGSKVRFLTTGALPSPFVAGTIYYVIAEGLTSGQFRLSTTLNGVAINTTTAGSGVHTFNPAITIIQTGTETVYISLETGASSTCTITNASPAVVTEAAHGLTAGDIIKFKTTDLLPIGISQGKLYFVKTVLTADTLTVSETLDGTAVNTSSAGSGVHSLIIIPSGVFTTENPHTFSIKDVVRFSTTGALPTGITSGTDYYVTGYTNVEFFNGPDFDKTSVPFVIPWVYIPNEYNQPSGSSPLLVKGTGTINSMLFLDAGASVKFFTNGALPPALIADTDYYLVKTNIVDIFGIAKSPGGQPIYKNVALGNGLHTVIDKNNFSISPTESGVFGTRVALSGTQTGSHAIFQETSTAFGTHTLFSSSYGFPEGCLTVSYMNGRFIACDPDTQDFYVSEVLDGKTWNAINVQTVDSNPDYVTGQIVSHNELIVFCENSGETYYDSGTTPTPFVRNLTGIFEVGCITPYTIQDVSGSIIFLGNSKNGNGIVYKMAGLTPVRISTYSIEYQIQQMSDISDARAFVYQKDGHHFYVLTFPTGNKTFVFDASTSVWHEREKYYFSGEILESSIGNSSSGIAFDNTTNSVWVVSTADNTVSKIGVITGIKVDYDIALSGTAISFDPVTESVWVSIPNGNVISKININTGSHVEYATGLFPSWSAFDSVTNSVWVSNYNSGTVSKINVTNGTKTDYATGNNPGYIAFDSYTNSVWVVNMSDDTVSKVNITDGTKTDYQTGIDPIGICFDSVTNSVWVPSSLENSIYKINVTDGTSLSFAVGQYPLDVTFDPVTESVWVSNANDQTFSRVNINTGAVEYSADTSPLHSVFDTTTESVWGVISNTNTLIQLKVTTGSTYWPVKKYLYFNGKHLVTDVTATLFSIDSSTYKNGDGLIRIVRSFRAPASDMKRVAHHTIQVDCEVGIGDVLLTEPVIALRWSDDAGNTWNTPIERGLGLVGDHAKSVIFRRLGATKGLPRIYELSCDENVKITLLDCYLE